MALAAGSPAHDCCPKCHSSEVKVALDTLKAVFSVFRLSSRLVNTKARHPAEQGELVIDLEGPSPRVVLRPNVRGRAL